MRNMFMPHQQGLWPVTQSAFAVVCGSIEGLKQLDSDGCCFDLMELCAARMTWRQGDKNAADQV